MIKINIHIKTEETKENKMIHTCTRYYSYNGKKKSKYKINIISDGFTY